METATLNLLMAAVEGCHWRWRHRMAEALAAQIDPDRFGVVAMYLLGSTKNANAGPESDIDILIHFRGTESQQKELTAWLQGWSLCLSEINYLLTGHKTKGLLDIHIITDLDIRNRTSFAVKIGAVTDAATPLSGCCNPKSEIRNFRAVPWLRLPVFPDQSESAPARVRHELQTAFESSLCCPSMNP
jgi:hypothetical protein